MQEGFVHYISYIGLKPAIPWLATMKVNELLNFREEKPDVLQSVAVAHALCDHAAWLAIAELHPRSFLADRSH